MQTTYSQNSILIDEERRNLFKNMIKKNSKIYPVKLVRYFESKYKPESEKTNPEYQHKSIENEVNNKSNILTNNKTETAPNKPSKPVINQTAKSIEDVNKRIQDEMKRIASENDIKPTIQRSQSSEQSL